MMNRTLNQRLRLAAYEIHELKAGGAGDSALRKGKERVLADVYRMLVYHLGVPPTEFEFRHKPKASEEEESEEDGAHQSQQE